MSDARAMELLKRARPWLLKPRELVDAIDAFLAAPESTPAPPGPKGYQDNRARYITGASKEKALVVFSRESLPGSGAVRYASMSFEVDDEEGPGIAAVLVDHSSTQPATAFEVPMDFEGIRGALGTMFDFVRSVPPPSTQSESISNEPEGESTPAPTPEKK